MAREDRKNKLAKEAATAEFNRICEEFNFNISTEAKERVISMKINNIDMTTNQELADADAFISKIMAGRIKFDEEKKQIVYVLQEPILTGADKSIKTTEFRFRKFTRSMQKSTKVENEKGKMVPVQLKEINFATMDDDKADAVMMSMTGISDVAIINGLEIQEYNDMRMIAGYFFS